MDDTKTYTSDVRVGDVIKCEDFENLLYKDMFDLDPMCGFYVNPRKTSKQWNNTRFTTLESLGLIKKSGRQRMGDNMINYKFKGDVEREYLIISVNDDCTCAKEFLTEDDTIPNFPLIVVCKMLSPDGEYDPNGIEITFRMRTINQPHAVNEVENAGFMAIKYERVF